MQFTLSPETLSMIAGVCLTLMFSYIPGLAVWFQAQDATKKSLVMLALLVAVSAGAFGLACVGWIQGLACTPVELQRLVWCLLLAVIANQAVYKLSPQVAAYKALADSGKPPQ